ncbi:hypothetical protein AB1046_09635 [Promicromonospora sp. Populi]|uniref:hypothetical protein n=1 Tax=Promicromonospora sp. Populi TaxID=3239420 RepID=UPI0034E2BD0A
MSSITPEVLLSGWRGRRFLLGLALDAESFLAERDGTEAPLAQAVMSAAYALDPNPGQILVAYSGPGPHVPVAVATREAAATPGTVASLLDAVRLTDVDQDSALHALAGAVDNARYWQEPDGDDVLAATPVVRAALERVAEHVAAAAAAVSWWSEPIAREDQHVVEWDDDAEPVPGRATGVANRLALWRADVVQAERQAAQHAAADPTASFSGAWWSTPPSDLIRTTRSLDTSGPAGLWLVEDGFGWERAVTRPVEVPADARVREIDSAEAWAALCREYPLEVNAKRHDWYLTTGRVGRWVVPDWAAVAVDHDAVHLTAAAYVAAAGTAIPVDDDAAGDTASVIAGWNPDETYWLVDGARPEAGGTTWVRDDEDWMPEAQPA